MKHQRQSRKNVSPKQLQWLSGRSSGRFGFDRVEVGEMVSRRQAFYEITAHEMPVLDGASFAAIVGIGPHFGYGSTEKTLLIWGCAIKEFLSTLHEHKGCTVELCSFAFLQLLANLESRLRFLPMFVGCYKLRLWTISIDVHWFSSAFAVVH